MNTMLKESFKFMAPHLKPLIQNHRLGKLGGHWSNAIGDISYLICQVTSQKHETGEPSNFMSWSSSWYVTTLPSLVAIGIAVVEV